MGARHATMLADRGAGIIVLDRDGVAAETTVDRVTQAGGNALAVAVDATDIPALQAGIRQAAADFGPVDILVNNAGIGGQGRSMRWLR